MSQVVTFCDLGVNEKMLANRVREVVNRGRGSREAEPDRRRHNGYLVARADPGVIEGRQKLHIHLERLRDPPECRGDGLRQVDVRQGDEARLAGHEIARALDHCRDRIPVRVEGDVAENFLKLLRHSIGHDVFPPACFFVDVLPVHADDIDEEALGETVLAHDLSGLATAFHREFQLTARSDRQQTITREPVDGLRDGRPGMLETLGDASTERRDAFLLQLVHRLEVHLASIDQISHFSSCTDLNPLYLDTRVKKREVCEDRIMLIPTSLLPADGRFGAGPSKVPADHASLDPRWIGTSHRQAPVKDVVGRIREGLTDLFGLPDGYEIALGNGGASLLWDAIPFCLVEDRARAATFGQFSAKAASAITKNPFVHDPEIDEAPAGSATLPTISDGIDTYLYPQNETSTGAMLPVTRCGDTDALTVVDATSAAGGVSFDPREADVYYFSPQKCFASDGGLWFAVLSPAAIARIDTLTSKRWVPDILNLRLALENSRKNQTLNTPALATLHLLDRQLDWMLAEGGLAAMDARTTAMSDLVYEWAARTEWAHPFVADQYRSQVVATIDVDLPADEISAICRRSGIVDIDGYRGLGRNQLRVATFPATEPDDVRALLESLSWVGQQLSPR